MSALTLQIGTPGHDALLRDYPAMSQFFAWLESTPDPLRRDCTRLDMLDESGTLFRCTHWVRDEQGNYMADGERCPQGSVHPIDFACSFCSERMLRQGTTIVSTPAPIPTCVLPYLAPSSAEGTPTP